MDETPRYIDAVASVLLLPIEAGWKAGVARYFDVARSMADLIAESGAMAEAESAAIFVVRDAE